MKVLCTGAAGSIGYHVILEILKQTDWDVIALDSFRHKGYHDRLHRLYHDNPEYIDRILEVEHDLVCPLDLDLEVDYIIHLAALSDVNLSIENPVYAIKNNIESTLTILEYARKVKPKAFIYFSTDEVYGPVQSIKEGHKEWETHRPSNAYAASKAASEDICYSYWRSYGVPLIITNTMNNFGEMQSKSKFPVVVQNKVNSGERVPIHGKENNIGSRFYVHSSVVGDALIYILNKGAYLHKTGELDEPLKYHIVGEKAFTNIELAELIAKLMNKPLEIELIDFHSYNPAHDIHYGLEDNKLKEIGWQRKKKVEDCLRDTIKWQEENVEWIK